MSLTVRAFYLAGSVLMRADERADYEAMQTVTDHGDEIAIATLYLLVMMVIAVLIRLAFRYSMLRSLQWDDGICLFSLVYFPPALATLIRILFSNVSKLFCAGVRYCPIWCHYSRNRAWLGKATVGLERRPGERSRKGTVNLPQSMPESLIPE